VGIEAYPLFSFSSGCTMVLSLVYLLILEAGFFFMKPLTEEEIEVRFNLWWLLLNLRATGLSGRVCQH